MDNLRSSILVNGQNIEVEWIRTDSIVGYSPITQVYGICFDRQANILICRKDSEQNWQLPGGKPEIGERLDETLRREVSEEANIEVDPGRMLGLQKVHYPNNPNKTEGDDFYQARMLGYVTNILPMSIDPATGKVWERKFVPAAKVTEFIHWGRLGAAIFHAALDVYHL